MTWIMLDDVNTTTNRLDHSLIDLEKVDHIDARDSNIYDSRIDGKVYRFYYIIVSFVNSDDDMNYYFRTEKERNAVYEALSKFLNAVSLTTKVKMNTEKHDWTDEYLSHNK